MKPLYFIVIAGILFTSCSTKKPPIGKRHFQKEHSLSEELRAFYEIG